MIREIAYTNIIKPIGFFLRKIPIKYTQNLAKLIEEYQPNGITRLENENLIISNDWEMPDSIPGNCEKIYKI